MTLASVVRVNTSVTDLPDNVFFVGRTVNSDITMQYDVKGHRVYVQGNRQDNSLLIMEAGFGLLLVGQNGSRINGQAAKLVPASRKANITIDLGAGQDSVRFLGVRLQEAIVVLGAEGDQLQSDFSRIENLLSDQSPGTASTPANSLSLRQ